MKKEKKIVIAGGSGYIGQALTQHFVELGFQVIVLSRSPKPNSENIINETWDGKNLGSWQKHLAEAELLVNLSGKSVDCRYTENNKREIMSSRIDSTRVLHQAIENCSNPPKLWLNSSTSTIYEGSRTKKMTEQNGMIGNDFSMTVAKNWEAEFFRPSAPTIRKIALRISLVLSEDGGVLPVLSKLGKRGAGGKMGNGTQKFAHISMPEFIRIIDFLIKTESIEGPVNCTSTLDITNAEFMSELRKKLNKKFYLNSPEWLLTIGGWIIGTEKELILKSRYVYPQKLVDAGFQFDNSLEKI